MEKYCSNPQYFKEKNYKTKFSISWIFKKLNQKIQFWKKIIKNKTEKPYRKTP
jgi:hypothetical protein